MNEQLITLELKELSRQLRSLGYSQERLLQLMASEQSIPASVFATQISPLQALVIYLKDHQNIPLSQVATLVKRTYRAVWGSYEHKELTIKETSYYIPVSSFNTTLSVLESVVVYLKDHYNLKYSAIARELNKDDRTIWTTYSRAKKK